MTLVKICGVRDADVALEAAKAGADFIGVMFAESKRRVTPQECHDVVEAVKSLRTTQGRDASFDGPGRGEVSAKSWFGVWADSIEQSVLRWRPLIVGVFAGQTVDEVNEIAEAAGLDMVQLSGGEGQGFIEQVSRPVLRAVHVDEGDTAFDVQDAIVPGAAAGILLDTASVHGQGGTGMTFDWDIAVDVGRHTPFLLAGGLSPDNVAEAVARVEPWGVDVSSGVETGGKKDIEKIQAFIRAAKGRVREGGE